MKFDGGGAGNSSSKTETQTENNDQRVVGGDSSTNQSLKVNVSGSGNQVSMTDLGAIDAGLQLALRGIEAAQSTAREGIAANGSLLTGVLRNADAQQTAVLDTLSNIKTADVRVLVIAGLAVVGLAAVFMFKKG